MSGFCEEFVDIPGVPHAGTYCKLLAGHDGPHSAHYQRGTEIPQRGDNATTTVEARGTTAPDPASRALKSDEDGGRAAGAQLTGQCQNGPSSVPACEQYPRAAHGGAGAPTDALTHPEASDA